MSGSFPVFDAVVEHLVRLMAPERALDIGAGSGKFGRLLATAVPACQRTAIEIEAGHVQRFDLAQAYHHVEVADAAQWWRDNAEETFDLVIVGDCLQHLSKSDGLDLLNAMVYRSAWLIVLVPEFIVQGAVEGATSSVHRSVWSERDLHWHDLWAWDNCRAMSLFVMRGYQPSALNIDRVMESMNDGAVSICDFDGTAEVRPCRLRLVDHGREMAYRAR